MASKGERKKSYNCPGEVCFNCAINITLVCCQPITGVQFARIPQGCGQGGRQGRREQTCRQGWRDVRGIRAERGVRREEGRVTGRETRRQARIETGRHAGRQAGGQSGRHTMQVGRQGGKR